MSATDGPQQKSNFAGLMEISDDYMCRPKMPDTSIMRSSTDILTALQLPTGLLATPAMHFLTGSVSKCLAGTFATISNTAYSRLADQMMAQINGVSEVISRLTVDKLDLSSLTCTVIASTAKALDSLVVTQLQQISDLFTSVNLESLRVSDWCTAQTLNTNAPIWSSDSLHLLSPLSSIQTMSMSGFFVRAPAIENRPLQGQKTGTPNVKQQPVYVLHHQMVNYFSESELKTVAFYMDIDFETLPHEEKSEFAREMITHLRHRGRLPDLVDYITDERPNVVWPRFPNTQDSDV